MLSSILTVENVAYYSVAIFIAAVIEIPGRAIPVIGNKFPRTPGPVNSRGPGDPRLPPEMKSPVIEFEFSSQWPPVL